MTKTDEIAEKVADKLSTKPSTPKNVRERNLNPSPGSSVELSASILTPQTGRAAIGDALRENYTIDRMGKNNVADAMSVWDSFSSVTSDTRISNLDPKDAEYRVVKWAMKMQLMALQLKCFNSAAFAQAICLSQTEPSLAKNMAFLKNIQTVRQESQHIQVEENSKKRNILGLFSKGDS